MTGLEKKDLERLETAYNTAKGLFEQGEYEQVYSVIHEALSVELRKGLEFRKYLATSCIYHATDLMSGETDFENETLLSAMGFIIDRPERHASSDLSEGELRTLVNYVRTAVNIANDETLKRSPGDKLDILFKEEFPKRMGDYIEDIEEDDIRGNIPIKTGLEE